METDNKLISLEITVPSKNVVWNRVLFSESAPDATDIKFYYGTLLGFGEDVGITITTESVPAEFNTSLLSLDTSAAPTVFPVNDLQTAMDESDKRKKYADFLHQLCEMERSRAALRFFARPVESKASASVAVSDEETYVSPHAGRAKRSWIHELLASLNPDYEYEKDALVVSNTASDGAETEKTPFGWVITPTVAATRKELGSRIILDSALGNKWQNLLGTQVYPDLIVSRRIDASSWAFQHATSDALVKSILDWYIASQDAKVVDGLTDFIVGSEEELARLFTTFRKIKINERFLTEGVNGNDRMSQVYKLLSSVESRLLETSASPVGEAAFTKYMNYLFRASGVPRELYADEDGVRHIIQRWVRSNYGFRADAEPLLSSWNEMWSVVMRGNPTATRVNHFLASLDCWDPMQAAILSNLEKAAISQEWVRIYLDNQLVSDPKGKVKSTILQDQIKQWCLRFVPVSVFTTQFSPMSIGPICTKRGLVSKKEKDGRYTHGVKFKSLIGDETGNEKTVGEMMETEDAVCGAGAGAVRNTVQYSEITHEDDGIIAQQRTLSVVAEGSSGATTRIEHFFSQSVTTSPGTVSVSEINLGSI